MDNIKLEGTPKTPTVHFNRDRGELILQGRSIPENSIDFYKPLIDWVEIYGSTAPEHTSVVVQLEYFNTSSSKCLLDFFKKLENIKKNGKTVSVKWHYEEDDEDMLEAGEDYNAIIEIDFEMVKVAAF